MKKLKKAYDFKKQLTGNNINELGNLLKNEDNVETIDINTDNTIYLTSNCGIDVITRSIEDGIAKWLNQNTEVPINMICNILPISNNSCIIKI